MRTYIKRLTIQGFKSFGRKTTIPFYPGFTAIVGENGTGKSNILDAITFVMGYRSRALRAGRIEHLLHTSPKGGTVPEAEVSLVLDNSAGTFDELLAEHADEVVISRRITATSSAYRIMGRVVAAGDVERLLSLADIEPGGYYIVEQGMVTEVLERSPRRRRELIEEVAGISTYEERKAKAIAELAQVKERLNASRILLAERRRHLVELHREREAALKYRELEAERDRVLATLKYLRFRELKEAEARLKEELRRYRAEAERLAREVAELDRKVEEIEWELRDREAEAEGDPDREVLQLVQRVERLRGELAAKEAEAKAKEREIRSLSEALEELKRLSPPPRRLPEAVQEILSLGWEGVIGVLGELGEVPPELQVALEAALGGHAHDLVVATRDVALRCVRYLKENEVGRARFLPLDKLALPPVSRTAKELLGREGVLGFLVDLISCPEEVRPAFRYVLADTLVVESLEVLRDVLGVRAVSLDGDLLERGGAITGGFRRKRVHRGPDLAGRAAQIERAKEELARLQAEVARLRRGLAAAEEELHRATLRQAQRKRTRSKKEDELSALRERRKEVYRALERTRGMVARHERELGEIQGKLAAIGEAPEPAEPVEGSANALQARLRELESRLSSFGPVNMRAIEEYEAYLTEFQAFKERVLTLEREKREIESLIGEIERRKKEKFLATLEAVSAELNRRFVQLFGGGEAGLSLEDPGDLSSGLLVRARPPGKEPKLLDALSGGEKTLVAIAFVLALSEGKPAPFYLFDEVDAALDKPNSERLAGLLREIAREAQVIVISHNEELIRHADRVYGVTMRGGSSRVLALELAGNAR
ncbi:chromosome segregation SMC family protein [Candidatus Bipolaricaulota sp. J31]